MDKRAVILAGGKGTRLKPFTLVLPKPLVPVDEYPILEIVIRQLAQFNFNHITIAVNHQADLIKAFFGNGEKWNIKIDYSKEEKPLSTMGPLKLIKDLPEDFLVMNGDILTDLDYSNFYRTHVTNKELYTILSKKREDKVEYGILETNEANSLIGFKEKPVNHYQVSTGIYMVNKKVLNDIPYNTSFGFDQLMLKFINDNKNVKVQPFDGYWLDIGRPDDYEKATDIFSKNKKNFLK